MPEYLTQQPVMAQFPALSSVQIAFLVSLVPGPRRTSDCHDAITVGCLMRLNLVAWNETRDRRQRRDNSTFSLTAAAKQFLDEGKSRAGHAMPAIRVPCGV